MKVLPALALIALAVTGPTSASHGTPSCSGSAPTGAHCRLTFVAEHDVVGVAVERGFEVALAGSLADEEGTRATAACAWSACVYDVPAGGLDAGERITIEVLATGVGFWRVAGVYGD